MECFPRLAFHTFKVLARSRDLFLELSALLTHPPPLLIDSNADSDKAAKALT